MWWLPEMLQENCLNFGRSVCVPKKSILKETKFKDLFVPPDSKYGSFPKVIYGTHI
jgi:hypothetical protein